MFFSLRPECVHIFWLLSSFFSLCFVNIVCFCALIAQSFLPCFSIDLIEQWLFSAGLCYLFDVVKFVDGRKIYIYREILP